MIMIITRESNHCFSTF